MQVLKISGAELDQPDFLRQMAATLAQITEATVIVHGGGKEITQLQAAFGIKPHYIDGLRASDEQSLELVIQVLCGSVNARFVTTLQLAVFEAQGLSGLDRGLVKAQIMPHPGGDLGRVGEVVSVRTEILFDLLSKKVIPVVAPICLGDDGAYNVNADHVAGAIGAELEANRVNFLTSVGGVLESGQLLAELTPTHAEALITQGVIRDGMIPKVRTAADVLARGAKEVLITNLEGLQTGMGTALMQDKAS
jgi:acetylglutamate kinase